MENEIRPGKSIIEFTQEEFKRLPEDRKKVVHGIDRAREAAYYYRTAYLAVVNAAHDILGVDAVGFAIYDKIMKKSQREREAADKKIREESEILKLSERIAAIKSWEKEVKARFTEKEGGVK